MDKKPRPFILCFEAHGEKHGRVWAVKHGKTWTHATEVRVLVPTRTVYRGPTAAQPKAFLAGIGIVLRVGDALVIR